jgi:hypothetical protein
MILNLDMACGEASIDPHPNGPGHAWIRRRNTDPERQEGSASLPRELASALPRPDGHRRNGLFVSLERHLRPY